MEGDDYAKDLKLRVGDFSYLVDSVEEVVRSL